jgi:hypothetical protein
VITPVLADTVKIVMVLPQWFILLVLIATLPGAFSVEDTVFDAGNLTELQFTFRGVPGRDGLQGPQGTQGSQGPTGPSGDQGI